jgi:hypothetical protein
MMMLSAAAGTGSDSSTGLQAFRASADEILGAGVSLPNPMRQVPVLVTPTTVTPA